MSFFQKKITLLFSLLAFVFPVLSQQLNYTLSRDFLWGIDDYYNNKAESYQTFSKPYLYTTIDHIRDSTAVFPNLFKGKTATDTLKRRKVDVHLYPLLNTSCIYQTNQNHFASDLAIGGNLMVNVGNKFSLNAKALFGNASHTDFTNAFIHDTQVIPGIGRGYLSNKDSLNPRFAYQYYSGYLSYSPNKFVNLQVGQDKHFFGDGYRSLFLSDVAAPYPFLKITTRIWHLTYVNLYTIMKDATNPSGLKKDWLTKYATFHYLGWNVTKRLNIGLFESIVWQGSDNIRHRGYDVNYLNPILFFRPTEYSLGSSDNAFVGFSFKIKLFKRQQLYGQLLLDEFLLKEVIAQKGWWANKQAYQLGFKNFDLFTIKRLNFQTEFNYVRPYTYSHGSVQQNYSHMNQPLAHPLGANFIESVNILNYRQRRLFIEAKCVYIIYGGDSAGTDNGRNIFISYNKRAKDYGNTTTQGIKTTLITTSLRVAYIVDARMNLKIEMGIANRTENIRYRTIQTPFIFVGIRTDLGTMYSDF